MNLDIYKAFAQTNTWGVLWVEISLVLIALGLLVLELSLPNNSKRCIAQVAIVGQVMLLIIAIGYLLNMEAGVGTVSFGGLIAQSSLTALMRVFFLIGGILVCYLATIYFSRKDLPRTEFYTISLISTAAFLLLIQSQHFVMLFVALETVTVAFYVMVAYCRTSSASLEAGLKYLILGALSSSLLLFGIVLLYGVAGNPALSGTAADPLNFEQLSLFIEMHPENPIVIGGAILVICGMAFKIGVVPFQIWIPDVYQGAPTPVTAFLAVCSKAAGFVVVMYLLSEVFYPLANVLIPLLSAVAMVTILFGNVAPLGQRNVKRVIGLSGVAHAGYLLAGAVALLMGEPKAGGAIIFYLITYLIGSFAVFAVMSYVSPDEDDNQTLDDYAGLMKTRPLLGLTLVCGVGSLAGIPPLVGFVGKFILFVSLYNAGLYALLAVAIVGVVISIYYYFGWIREAVFRTLKSSGELSDVKIEPTGLQKATLVGLLLATIILGFYQGGIVDMVFALV